MSDQNNASEHQTFSNENIEVKVSKKPNCVCKFEIKVYPTASEAAYQKALKNVCKEVSIPGFRKGKAPISFVTDKYASAISQEFNDILMQTAFNEALGLSQLSPLKDGKMKVLPVKKASREEGAEFSVEFETALRFPQIDLATISVDKVKAHEITEKEIDESVEQIRYRLGKYEEVKDRPVEEGDFIDLSVTLLGGFPKLIENHRVQVKTPTLPHWLKDKVVGVNVNETFEGMTERENETEAEFESVPFTAVVRHIFTGVPAELTQEELNKIGIDSLEDLREKLRFQLIKAAEDDAFESQTDKIEEELVKMYPLEIPQSFIDQENSVRLRQYLEPLMKEGLKAHIEQNIGTIRQNIQEITINRLRAYFLLHSIAVANNIQCTEEEVTEEFARQNLLTGIGRGRLNQYSSRDELMDQLHNLATEHKVKNFLIEKVLYTE